MQLVPIRYEVVGHSFKQHSVFIESRGRTGWVCTTGENDTLNTDGEFEYEPFPSGRTDDYISRTRFDSPEAALANFERHLATFGDHW